MWCALVVAAAALPVLVAETAVIKRLRVPALAPTAESPPLDHPDTAIVFDEWTARPDGAR